MTAIHQYSKPDTVLLLDFAAGNDQVDYSQYRTNITNNTTYLSEANSARTAIGGVREIALIVQLASADSGILVNHGNAGTTSYRIQLDGSGNVRFIENAIALFTVAIPGLTITERNVLIHWSQFMDGSNVRSEALVYNFSTGAFATGFATHTLTTPNAAHTLTINGQNGGGSGHSGGLADWNYLRIGRRHHSLTEAREDWISTTGAGSTTQTRRGAPLVPNRATLTDLAADDTYIGPGYLWSGHAFRESDRRLVGALVNHRAYDPVTITNAYSAYSTAWWRLAPGDSNYHMCIAHLWRRPVPAKVNRAYVRLFVKQTCSTDTVTAQVRYRAYSMTGLPVVGKAVGPLTYHRTAAATCSTDHGVGVGEWLSLGELVLAVDDLGFSWLSVAVDFDDAAAQAATTSAFIYAATFEPYHAPAEDGALDIEGA